MQHFAESGLDYYKSWLQEKVFTLPVSAPGSRRKWMLREICWVCCLHAAWFTVQEHWSGPGNLPAWLSHDCSMVRQHFQQKYLGWLLFFFFFKFLFLFLFLFLYLFSFSYFSFLLEDTMWNITPHLKLCTNITRGLALFYSLNLSSPSFLFIPRIFTEQNHAVLRFIYFFFLRLAKNCL